MKKLIFGALLLGATTFSFAKTASVEATQANKEISTNQKTILSFNAKDVKSIESLKASVAKAYQVQQTDVYVFIFDDWDCNRHYRYDTELISF